MSKASFVKFRAQSVDFLEVSNPRALLEVALRKFTCLTVGDTICIPHANKKFYLDVREVQPNGAASIIETDCNVDFEEPLGYQDSKYGQQERQHKENIAKKSMSGDGTSGGIIANNQPRSLQKARSEPTEAESIASQSFQAFSGSAKRIDGKIPASVAQAKQSSSDNTPNTSNKCNSLGGDFKTAAESKSNYSKVNSASSSDAKSIEPVAPTYQSRIGDKYSKKKTAVSAFTGTAHKLNP